MRPLRCFVSSIVLLTTSIGGQAYAQEVDHGGGDYSPVNGERINTDQVNIGRFVVAAGTTVSVDGAVLIQASEIVVEGTLDATGTGPVGGYEQDVFNGADTIIDPGGPGGGGIGGFGDPWPTAQASGGGGHGGPGGRAQLLTSPSTSTSQRGFGGMQYGTPSDPLVLDMGSGGGRPELLCGPCETGRGGRGGGAIALRAWTRVDISGVVRVNGGDGTGASGTSRGAGGGGSGGTIIIDAQSITFTGALEARGGEGGVRTSLPGNGAIGGGGSGGRIKIFGARPVFSGTVDVEGGGAGPTLGSSGTSGGTPGPQDIDGDGVLNGEDPCPADFFDDADGDGICANADPCPADDDNDSDGDGLCLADDNCPAVRNPDQANQDFDICLLYTSPSPRD